MTESDKRDPADDRLRDLAKDIPWDRPSATRRDAIRSSLLVEAAESNVAPTPAPRRWLTVGSAFVAGALAAAAIAVIVVRRGADPSRAPITPAQITASPDAKLDHQIVTTDTGVDEIVHVRDGKVRLTVPAVRRGDHVRVRTKTAEVEGDAGELEVVVVANSLEMVTVRTGTARVVVAGQAPVFLSAGQTWRSSIITTDLSPTTPDRVAVRTPDTADVRPADDPNVGTSTTPDAPTTGQPGTPTPGAPTIAPGAPTIEPGAQTQPGTPTTKPSAPMPGTPTGNTTKPGTPTTASGEPTTKPGTPTTPNTLTTTKPGTTTNEPGAPTTKPGTQTAQPGTPTTKPGAPTIAKTGTTNEPAAPTTKPGAPTTKPGAPSKPGAPTTKSGVADQKPNVVLEPPKPGSPTATEQKPVTDPDANKPTVIEPVKPDRTKQAAIEQQFRKGWELLRAGKAREAAIELGVAADSLPQSPLAADARYWQAVALIRSGQARVAERVLVQFLDNAPQSLRRGRAAVLLGRVLAERGDRKSATAWFQSAVSDPDPAIANAARAGLQALQKSK